MPDTDPQGSMGFILKPPADFQAVYQGKSRLIPIPFVAADQNGEFVALDPAAGSEDVATNLLRFVPVPIGSSALILIPRALYNNAGTLVEVAYRYDIRWRLRSLTDYTDPLVRAGDHEHPYSLVPTLGSPSTPAPLPRRVMPAYGSEQVTPAMTGSERRPLITSSLAATLSQGIYNQADFATIAGPPDGGDDSIGLTYYPPLLRAIVGNELSICASFTEGNWDFSTATGDAGFANLYGNNPAGPSGHPVYPGVGIILIVLSRSTTP